MAQYDGSIRINTQINTQNASAQLMNLANRIEKTADKIASLRSKMDALKDVKIPTQEYKAIESDIAKAERELEKLIEKQAQMQRDGKDSGTAWDRINQRIQAAKDCIEQAKTEQQELVNSGKTFTLGTETEEYKKAEADAKNYENTLEALTQKQQELNGTTKAMSDAEYMRQAEENIDRIIARLEEARQKEAETPAELLQPRIVEMDTGAFQEGQREAQALADAIASVGQNAQDSAAKSNEAIASMTQELAELKARQKELEKAGMGLGFEEYDTNVRRIAEINEALKNYRSGLTATELSHRKLGESVKQFGKSAKSVFSSLNNLSKKLNSAFKKLVKTMSGFFKTSKKTTESNNNLLKSGLKFILKYGLGIRSLYVLVNKIRNGIKEGFSNFMEYSSKFKSSIDSIKASALTLKNAFAAAFSPLVEIAIPYIQRVIDYLVKLLDVIGQVMAAITGQETYTRAIKQTTAAIEDQNKAQNKQLSGLDKLNNLTSSSGGGGAGGGAADMFEEAPIEDKWKDLAQKIKKIGKDLFKPLKKAWDKEGKFVMDSWKYALDEVKKLLKDIGRDFMTVWNQPETVAMFEDIFHIVGDIGLVVGNLARNFRAAWNENKVGLHIFENIRDILAVIIHNIRLAADYTVEWSDKLDFYPLLSKIEEWTKSLIPVFDALSGIVMDFYTMVLLPLAKWTLEKGLPDLLQVFIDFNKKVDWEALRKNLKEFWKHLEPFAETVGEGLILFIRDISDALTGFLNSQQFKDFLKSVEDWMDKVTPRDVADGLEKLAKAVISIKLALLGFKAIVSVAKGLTMAKAFFAIWKGGSGAAMASEMTAAAGGIGGLSGALSAFASNAALAASVAGLAVAAFEPFKKLTTDFDNNAEVRFYEEYKGFSGTLNLIKDSFNDLTNKVYDFDSAMETANEGIILTDEQIKKLYESGKLINDDIESIIDATVDLHPELAAVREEFGLWDTYPETLSNIAQGVGLIKDGTVDAGKAFEEFKEPMYGMTEDALAFFSQIQDGTISVTDAHNSMKEQIVANNGEMSASNDALEIDLSDHTAEWTTDMQIITDEHGNMVLDVSQGSDDLKNTFESNNSDIITSNDSMSDNFSQASDNISGKVSDISGSLDGNKGRFSSWAESVGNSLKSVWESAKLWIGKAIDKIGELMSSIGSAVSSAFSGGSSGSTASVFSSARAARSFSQVASPYSAMPQMEALSKMEFPGYATGQVIPTSMKKHLAWLGDNNHETEVVSPLSTMKQANKEAILEVLSELGMTGGNERRTDGETFVFQVDGKTFFEVTRKEAQQYFSRTGRSPYPT